MSAGDNDSSDPIKLNFKRGPRGEMESSATKSFSEALSKLTLAAMRQELGDLEKTDQFLDVQEFPVPIEEEAGTHADEVVVIEKLKDKELRVVRILVPDKKERKAVELPDWPEKSPEHWKSTVMDNMPMPDIPPNKVAQAEPGANDFETWDDFDDKKWRYLITTNCLLSGVRTSDTLGPKPSAYNLFDHPPPLKDFHTYRNPNSEIEVTTTYNERDSRYVSQGWTTAALAVKTPFVSGAADGGEQHMNAHQTLNKKIFTTAKYKFGFVTLVMEPSTLKATEQFNAAIDKAMTKSDKTEKVEALKQVFEKYGHTFQTEVTLGGLLVSTESTITNATKTQSKHEWDVRLKMKGAVASGLYAAEGNVGHGEQDESVEQNIDVEMKSNITAKGGITLYSSAIGRWISSNVDYRTWRVIDVRQAVSVVEFVDPKWRDEVLKIAAANPSELGTTTPLIGRWVEPIEYMTNALSNNKRWLRTYRPFVAEGSGWYWLGPSLDRRRALIVKESGVVDGKGNALCGIADLSLIWCNTLSEDDDDDESFWKLHPANQDYLALGDIFQAGPGSSGNFDQPNHQSNPLMYIRAVRRDLLVPACLTEGRGEDRYFQNYNKGTDYDAPYKKSKWGTAYGVSPKSNPSGNGEDCAFLFKAFMDEPNTKNFSWHEEMQVMMINPEKITIVN